MAVDPTSVQHSSEYGGTTWYFCAAGCRQQFMDDPEQFASPPVKNPASSNSRRTSMIREVAIALAVFVAVVAVVVMARGIARNPSSAQQETTAVGNPAGTDQAVDGGQGNVIANATYERNKSNEADVLFVVSLNTHTIDLTSFDPERQIRLHVGDDQGLPPRTVEPEGEQSSHHQNYRLSFRRPTTAAVVLSIHDTAGVSERKLPFTL